MKIARRKTSHIKPAKSPIIILDEFHAFAPEGSSFAALLAKSQMKKHNMRKMIVTQAIMKFNSGKRVRFLGSIRWADTGESIKQVPNKFVPAQVVRRAAA